MNEYLGQDMLIVRLGHTSNNVDFIKYRIIDISEPNIVESVIIVSGGAKLDHGSGVIVSLRAE